MFEGIKAVQICEKGKMPKIEDIVKHANLILPEIEQQGHTRRTFAGAYWGEVYHYGTRFFYHRKMGAYCNEDMVKFDVFYELQDNSIYTGRVLFADRTAFIKLVENKTFKFFEDNFKEKYIFEINYLHNGKYFISVR